MATLTEWFGSLRVGEILILAGLVAALALALFRWWRVRREAARRRARMRDLERRFEAIGDARDGIAVFGPGERIVYANPSFGRLVGRTGTRDVIGKNWRALLPVAEASRLERDEWSGFRDRGEWVGLLELEGPPPGRTVEVSMTALRNGGMIWMARDAGWLERDEESHRQREARWRSLVEAAGSVIVLLGPEGEVLEWNREAERLFLEPRQRVLGRDFAELVAVPEERGRVTGALREARAEGSRRRLETLVCPEPSDSATGESGEGEGEGVERRVLWTISPLEVDGDGTRLVVAGHDVTGRKAAEEALRRQEGLYRLLAKNSSDLIALHDPDGRFLYVSPSCMTLLGYREAELLGTDPYRISHSDDWRRLQSALVAARSGQLHRMEFRLRKVTGEYVWFETLIRPIRDEEGEIRQLQSSSRDISERKTFEAQLEYQALHEPLTDLPNRTLFMDRLGQALARARREGTSVAVMFMDLDRFKVINDSLGHAAGDRLLAAIAKRLRACLREADTVARLGGDEFGVLLEFSIAAEDAAGVAERVLEQLEPPFTFAGQDLFVSASIGIAFSGPDTQTPEDILRFADIAMFRAKEEGPGAYRVYDPALDVQATRRLHMETGLRRALEREELQVYYQPLVSLETGRIAGVEALIRWVHPERGMVGPGEFIPVAEESGLIIPIGRHVLRKACARADRWASEDEEPFLISVNLSSRQFEHPDLIREIATILEQTGTDPAALQLEITESELLQNAGRIQKLKELGVRIAIDDFGTGYSSLAYLKNLPVDALKIDRTFVSGIGRSHEDEAIVQTVITLADSLGLEVTAEGIETESQLERLRELRCRSGQGYLFARPAPGEETDALIASEPTW